MNNVPFFMKSDSIKKINRMASDFHVKPSDFLESIIDKIYYELKNVYGSPKYEK